MKPLRIHLDAHAHVYPFHDLPRLLLAALDHMPRHAPADQRVLVLAERADCSFSKPSRRTKSACRATAGASSPGIPTAA